MFDVIIIGAGPAGMTAALYLLRNQKKVLLLEKEAVGGQIAKSPKLENFPTIKSISGADFANNFLDQLFVMGVDFDLEEVIKIEKINSSFEVTTNYHKYESKAVIIANGVTPRYLNLSKEKDFVGKGISYCAVCDGPFFKGQNTLVIGDANSALQYALLLSDYSPKVYLYTLFDKLFGEKVIIDKILKNPKIIIKHNMEAKKLNGEKELTGVTFKNKTTNEEETLNISNCFVAIGQVPHNEIFNNLTDLEKGFIKTKENMETKTPLLYAVGDTRVKDLRQVITACNDGTIAAIDILKKI